MGRKKKNNFKRLLDFIRDVTIVGAIITGVIQFKTTKMQLQEARQVAEASLQYQQKSAAPFLSVDVRQGTGIINSGELSPIEQHKFELRMRNAGKEPAINVSIQLMAVSDDFVSVIREPGANLANGLVEGVERAWSFRFGTLAQVEHLRVLVDYDSAITGQHYSTPYYFDVFKDGENYQVSEASTGTKAKLEVAANHYSFGLSWTISRRDTCFASMKETILPAGFTNL